MEHDFDKTGLQDSIRDTLRKCRRRKADEMGCKLTQQDVAEAVGISRSHLAAAESGHANVSLEVMARLSQFYDVSLDYLAGFSVSPLKSSGPDIKTLEEATLLRGWRAMDDSERAAFKVFLNSMRRDVNAA